MAGYAARLKRSWKFFLAILIPIAFLPVLLSPDTELIPVGPKIKTEGSADEEELTKTSTKFKLAYVILVMAVYWALEIIPLPITSLFPLVLFPLLGIDDAADVSKSYMKESNTIFLGGAIVALAVEYCNLHRRVALRLITIVGVSPKRLMFGIMAVVSFLSMWISNTTCTTMIVPIIIAIVDEIHEVTDATNNETEINSTTNKREYHPGENNGFYLQAPGSRSSTPRRHSVTFSNAALSSHSNRTSVDTTEVDNQRGTFGLLEGHRPDSTEADSYSQYRHHRRRSSLGGYRRHSQPALNKSFAMGKPVPLQVSLIRGELAAEIPESSRATIVNQQSRSTENNDRRNSEPSQIEIVLESPSSPSDCHETERTRQKMETEKRRKTKNMYLLALAYAANIGGTATITGTGPNKVFKEAIKPYSYDISQDGKYVGMTFFTWLAFNLPPMLVNVVVAWFYLTVKNFGVPKFSKSSDDKKVHAVKLWKEKHVRSYLLDEYKKLGKMRFHEIGVAMVFLLVAFLWILRDPQMFHGWHEVESEAQTGDSTAALLGAVLLFIIPRSSTFLTSKNDAKLEALLDWKFVNQKLPWGVLLLLGSGYAIGDSANRTGLTRWIGKELYLLHNLPEPLLLLIVMLVTALITEVTSNTACASIILPVLLGLSKESQIHPLYLSVAATVTASYAFMLPVASPVNAIVFAAGDFSIFEMITTGYILNGICVLVFYINTLTLGERLFKYSEFSYPRPPEFD